MRLFSRRLVRRLRRIRDIGNRETASEAGTELAYTANALNQYSEILGEAVSNRFAGLPEEENSVKRLKTASPLSAFNPVYDADGNATQIQTSTGTRIITYNGENRPVRAWRWKNMTVESDFLGLITSLQACFANPSMFACCLQTGSLSWGSVIAKYTGKSTSKKLIEFLKS